MANDAKLEIRLPADLKMKFQEVCLSHYDMPHAEMLRELIAATVEKRVTLSPPKKHKRLYNDD
jgi:hypothetical protein